MVSPRGAPALPALIAVVRSAFQGLEDGLDRWFGAAANPLRQLGALAFWFFWASVASGIYVYVYYETSVDTAYSSIEHLSQLRWQPGAVMRSLHRYASDGFMLVILLHLVRELVYRRYRGFRWFTWTTGVPLILLGLASGIVGYWLVWDTAAQFIGIAAAESLGALPGFGPGLVRNFIAPEAVSDRFFSLLSFAHIAVSLLLLLGMWIHIQRITHARVRPARALGWGTLAALIGLWLMVPALSQVRADLSVVPRVVGIDWFFFGPLVLADARTPATMWISVGALTVFLGMLPWMARAPRLQAARVNPDECNGCGRCFADCPYGAVVVLADGNGTTPRAKVIEDLCAGCGICVGACPSANPFRSKTRFASGIELPQLPLAIMRARLDRALRPPHKTPPVVVFGCDHGARIGTPLDTGIVAFSLPCIGMLPPSFIEYALRHGAAGVMVAACGADCEFRLGHDWMGARIAGEREPRLRAARDRRRIHFVNAGPGNGAALAHEAATFRQSLAATLTTPADDTEGEAAVA